MTTLFALCFTLSSSTINAQCIETTVSTTNGETSVTTCTEDGNDDIIYFKPDIFATAYAYIVTDENNIILDIVVNGSSINFEGAPPGICRVWGMSYAGVITAGPGDNAATVELTDFCYILSSNFVEIVRTGGLDINGGSVGTPAGETTVNTCPGDGNPDVVEFSNTGSTVASYTYVITDENFIILGIPTGNSQDFDGAPEGTCLVWGLSYTGNVIAMPGDDATSTPLADGCWLLSDNFITVIRSAPEGGMVETTNGETEVSICSQDGIPDIVEFTTVSSVTVTIMLDDYPEETSWKILDGNNTVVASGGTYASSPDGSTIVIENYLEDGCYDFTINDSAGDGLCCDYGIGSYTVTDQNNNVLASGGAFGSSETTNFCLSTFPYYAYVITDENNIILDFANGNSQDFDGAPEGTCRVWALSYTGNIIANVGDDAAAVPLTDDCYELSSNFIEVVRTSVDGGGVANDSGEYIIELCEGDGEDDIVTFQNSSTSSSNYVYIITDYNPYILEVLPGNSHNFEGSGIGLCLVWGLSYTGNIIANVGDDIFAVPLTDDCYDLSFFPIEVYRTDDPAVCGPSPSDFGNNGESLTEANALSTQFYNADIQLYPNPVSEILTIRVESEFVSGAKVLVRVFDASGKRMMQSNYNSDQIELNVGNLPTGLFTLQVTTDDFSKTKYFVKE